MFLHRYNIRYGRPEATDAEVEAAAASAGLHEKIQGFPKKYDLIMECDLSQFMTRITRVS